MTKTLRMSYDDMGVTRKSFYSAQSNSEENKNTTPESVDDGDGMDYIVKLMIKITRDAGYITPVSKLSGDKVAGAIDKTKGVDKSAAQTFRDMDKKVTSRTIIGVSMSRSLETYHLSTMLFATWKIYAVIQVTEAACLIET